MHTFMSILHAVVVGGVNRGSSSRSGENVSSSSSSSRLEGSLGGSGEPYVTLAGPDAVCVQAMFGEPSDSGQGGLSKSIRGSGLKGKTRPLG